MTDQEQPDSEESFTDDDFELYTRQFLTYIKILTERALPASITSIVLMEGIDDELFNYLSDNEEDIELIKEPEDEAGIEGLNYFATLFNKETGAAVRGYIINSESDESFTEDDEPDEPLIQN